MHTVQLLPLVLPGHSFQTSEFRMVSAQECHMSPVMFSTYDQSHRRIRARAFSLHQPIQIALCGELALGEALDLS
jgi:hypothetical protein